MVNIREATAMPSTDITIENRATHKLMDKFNNLRETRINTVAIISTSIGIESVIILPLF